MNFEWLNISVAKYDETARRAAIDRQAQLTKPPGALGELETLAINLAAMQGKITPNIDHIHIGIFAADHGIAANGVSAFPQAVTTEMVKNFANGGAAINVLAKSLNANLSVTNVGTLFDPGPLANVIDQRITPGTKDFSHQAAMTKEQLHQALNIGRQTAERAEKEGADLFIGGEMGIGNTTSATAIACAILNKTPEELTGRGTGLDDAGLQHKINVLKTSLEKHQNIHDNVVQVLRHYGGFEIAALTGSFLACAKMGLPVLVDGFIATTAALCASKTCEGSSDWFFYAHVSAESGHRIILEALNAKPLLNLGMRLGEGSGAAVAVPLLQMACRLHNEMATFDEAGVSNKD